MTVVPNQANDMMDIGRLQGFEVRSFYMQHIFLNCVKHLIFQLNFEKKGKVLIQLDLSGFKMFKMGSFLKSPPSE